MVSPLWIVNKYPQRKVCFEGITCHNMPLKELVLCRYHSHAILTAPCLQHTNLSESSAEREEQLFVFFHVFFFFLQSNNKAVYRLVKLLLFSACLKKKKKLLKGCKLYLPMPIISTYLTNVSIILSINLKGRSKSIATVERMWSEWN